MTESFFQFAWPVSSSGYKWIKMPGKKSTPIDASEWRLRSSVPTGGWTMYQPLKQYPALFRTFADVHPSLKECINFANQYGDLHRPLEVVTEFGIEYSSTYSDWRTAIAEMRKAVALWDLVHQGDREGLAKHIIWDKPDSVRYNSQLIIKVGRSTINCGGALITCNDFRPQILKHLHPGDVIKPALYYLQQIVNERMSGSNFGDMGGNVSPRMLWAGEKLEMFQSPNNLIGALWLQLAQAITGDKDYGRCQHCNNWYELSAADISRGKSYCTNACKSKNYRARKVQALKFAADGLPLKEIAKQLGTDTNTAKKWISQADKK